MTSAGATVLFKVLHEDVGSLDSWARLQLEYFSPELRPIYKAISKFYTEYNRLPKANELLLATEKRIDVNDSLVLLLSSDIPEDVPLNFVTDVLIDEHVQNLALDHIESFVNKITSYNAEEIVGNIAEIAYDIETKVKVNSSIYTIDQLDLMEEQKDRTFIPLNLNNDIDSKIIGVMRGELVVVGGKRGNGKSLICSNLCVNEYNNGFVVPYFTIEMRAAQIYRRNAAIEAGVSAMRLRSGKPDAEEQIRLAQKLIDKYDVDPNEWFERFRVNDNSLLWLQKSIKESATVRQDRQMIIIDNPQLSLADIDTSLQKLKSRYGDSMRMAIVDYINQISPSGKEDKFDWKFQINIASTLKALAEKHDVVMVAPYQIDANGEARFSKGILDSPDYAILLQAYKTAEHGGTDTVDAMKFSTTKARDVPPFEAASAVDWHTLKIKSEDNISMDKLGKDTSPKEESSAEGKPVSSKPTDLPGAANQVRDL